MADNHKHCTIVEKHDLLVRVILRHPDITLADARVAAALIGHLNDHSGRCDPSAETLAAETGLERRSVVRATNHLVSLGLLRKDQRWRGGRSRSNHYVFDFTPVRRKTVTQPSSSTDGHVQRAKTPRPMPPKGRLLPEHQQLQSVKEWKN